MTLTSPDFADGRPIPRVHAYTGEGENRPPRLAWSSLPTETVELALIVDDPDAPRPEPWVHDVLFNIPVDATPDTMVLRGATVDSARRFLPGANSWARAGLGRPVPAPGRPAPLRLHALRPRRRARAAARRDQGAAAAGDGRSRARHRRAGRHLPAGVARSGSRERCRNGTATAGARPATPTSRRPNGAAAPRSASAATCAGCSRSCSAGRGPSDRSR
ncbi:MAG: hypothetical protein MZV63_06090 [Marinilabiliales bacterium]|nr:hypothetical protein [Marinilabiliales bacterium]